MRNMSMMINKGEEQTTEALLLRKGVKYKYIRILLMFSKKEQQNDKLKNQGFPVGAAVENLPANAGNTGSSPGLGRSHMPRSN